MVLQIDVQVLIVLKFLDYGYGLKVLLNFERVLFPAGILKVDPFLSR